MSDWRADARVRVRALGTALHRPGPERDALLLLLKAALAAVLAWQFALHVLNSPIPFYAPMAALLVVDRTMVRSIAGSAQRVAAVVLGLGFAWLAATWFGATWWTMFGVTLVALVISRWSRLGTHGAQVPSMVLLSLITAGGTDEQFTYLTIVETVAGGVIGVATNAIVLTPLHLTKPRQRVAALARQVRELLSDIATGLEDGWDEDSARGWYRRGNEITDTAPHVIDDIETGRESTRLNPRANLRPAAVDWEGYASSVVALRRCLWHVTGVARTLVDAADPDRAQPVPSPSFLDRYAEALRGIGHAVSRLGRRDAEGGEGFDAAAAQARTVLVELRDEVRETPLDDPQEWPVYGSLINDGLLALQELEDARERAAVPTPGPVRRPVQHRGLFRLTPRRHAEEVAPPHGPGHDAG
jgi:hypothetical protein